MIVFYPKIFLITIFVMFLILYIRFPNPEVVIKYPNIEDEKSDLYVDDNNVCYRYHREPIEWNTLNKKKY